MGNATGERRGRAHCSKPTATRRWSSRRPATCGPGRWARWSTSRPTRSTSPRRSSTSRCGVSDDPRRSPRRAGSASPDWTLIRTRRVRRRPAHVRAAPAGRAVPRRDRGHDLEPATHVRRAAGKVEEPAVRRRRQARLVPDSAPTRSGRRGMRAGAVLFVAGVVLTFVLARWTTLGLLGIPVIVGGLCSSVGAEGCRLGPRRAPPCRGGSAGSGGDRDRRDAHVAVGGEGDRLHPVPAVRRRLRVHGQVGEGVRGPRVCSPTPAGTCSTGRSCSRSSASRWTGSR